MKRAVFRIPKAEMNSIFYTSNIIFMRIKILFNDFDLKITSGEMIALTVISGCGKSTLLNMVGLIEPPDSGSISIHGELVSNIRKSKKSRFIRSEISYIFQNFALIDSDSVYSNLALALYYTIQN